MSPTSSSRRPRGDIDRVAILPRPAGHDVTASRTSRKFLSAALFDIDIDVAYTLDTDTIRLGADQTDPGTSLTHGTARKK